MLDLTVLVVAVALMDHVHQIITVFREQRLQLRVNLLLTIVSVCSVVYTPNQTYSLDIQLVFTFINRFLFVLFVLCYISTYRMSSWILLSSRLCCVADRLN